MSEKGNNFRPNMLSESMSIPVQTPPYYEYPSPPQQYSSRLQQMPNLLGVPAPYFPERSNYASEMVNWQTKRPMIDKMTEIVEIGSGFLPIPLGVVAKSQQLSRFVDNTKKSGSLLNSIKANKKTWYHGTNRTDLTAEGLSPDVTRAENLFGQGVYFTDNPEIAKGYATARSGRQGTPTVYQAKINVNRVLDLESPITPKVDKVIRNRINQIAENVDEEILDDFDGYIAKYGKETAENYIRAFSKAVSDTSHRNQISAGEFYDDFSSLAEDLRKLGYDAMTHTGGKRTGKPPHQVMILIDPNDFYQLGRKPNVTSLIKQGD